MQSNEVKGNYTSTTPIRPAKATTLLLELRNYYEQVNNNKTPEDLEEHFTSALEEFDIDANTAFNTIPENTKDDIVARVKAMSGLTAPHKKFGQNDIKIYYRSVKKSLQKEKGINKIEEMVYSLITDELQKQAAIESIILAVQAQYEMNITEDIIKFIRDIERVNIPSKQHVSEIVVKYPFLQKEDETLLNFIYSNSLSGRKNGLKAFMLPVIERCPIVATEFANNPSIFPSSSSPSKANGSPQELKQEPPSSSKKMLLYSPTVNEQYENIDTDYWKNILVEYSAAYDTKQSDAQQLQTLFEKHAKKLEKIPTNEVYSDADKKDIFTAIAAELKDSLKQVEKSKDQPLSQDTGRGVKRVASSPAFSRKEEELNSVSSEKKDDLLSKTESKQDDAENITISLNLYYFPEEFAKMQEWTQNDVAVQNEFNSSTLRTKQVYELKPIVTLNNESIIDGSGSSSNRKPLIAEDNSENVPDINQIAEEEIITPTPLENLKMQFIDKGRFGSNTVTFTLPKNTELKCDVQAIQNFLTASGQNNVMMNGVGKRILEAAYNKDIGTYDKQKLQNYSDTLWDKKRAYALGITAAALTSGIVALGAILYNKDNNHDNSKDCYKLDGTVNSLMPFEQTAFNAFMIAWNNLAIAINTIQYTPRKLTFLTSASNLLNAITIVKIKTNGILEAEKYTNGTYKTNDINGQTCYTPTSVSQNNLNLLAANLKTVNDAVTVDNFAAFSAQAAALQSTINNMNIEQVAARGEIQDIIQRVIHSTARLLVEGGHLKQEQEEAIVNVLQHDATIFDKIFTRLAQTEIVQQAFGILTKEEMEEKISAISASEMDIIDRNILLEFQRVTEEVIVEKTQTTSKETEELQSDIIRSVETNESRVKARETQPKENLGFMAKLKNLFGY